MKGSKSEYKVEVIRAAREEENMGSNITLKVSKGEEPLWVKENEKNKWKEVKLRFENKKFEEIRYKETEKKGGG